MLHPEVAQNRPSRFPVRKRAPHRLGWVLVALSLATMSAEATLRLETPWTYRLFRQHWDTWCPEEHTQPVIQGDIVYIASSHKRLIALHREKGYILWSRDLPGSVQGGLTYARSHLYIADIDGNLLAVNAHNGEIDWKFKTDASFLSAPAVVRGHVYAMASSDDLYALSEIDGHEEWHHGRHGDDKMTVYGTSAPVLFGGAIYQGFSDGVIEALTALHGKSLWYKRIAPPSATRFIDADTTPSVNEKDLVASSFDGTMANFDRLSGSLEWLKPYAVVGGFVERDGRIFFSATDHFFYAMERSSGKILWKTPYADGLGQPPSTAGDYLIFTTSGHEAYILAPEDGHIEATLPLGAGSFAQAAGNSDGWFYILTNYGNVVSARILGKQPGRDLLNLRRYSAPSAVLPNYFPLAP